MKIFLTSSASIVLDKIAKKLPRPASKLKVAFIRTAANPYPEKPWADKDRDKLVELGFLIIDLDIAGKKKKDVADILSKVDIIFVAGGNCFYLLNEARKSGFDKIARELVKKGKIYIGSSAGSYLACPNIEAAGWKHADKNIVNLKDLTALNLVDFLVVCHYSDKFKEVVASGKKSTQYPVMTLTDEQYIFADGEKHEKIS